MPGAFQGLGHTELLPSPREPTPPANSREFHATAPKAAVLRCLRRVKITASALGAEFVPAHPQCHPQPQAQLGHSS